MQVDQRSQEADLSFGIARADRDRVQQSGEWVLDSVIGTEKLEYLCVIVGDCGFEELDTESATRVVSLLQQVVTALSVTARLRLEGSTRIPRRRFEAEVGGLLEELRCRSTETVCL